MNRYFPLLFFLLFSFHGISQEIVRQKPLDNMDQVLFSRTGEHLLVQSGTSYTLIDAGSRLQLGSMDIETGSNTYPNQGKTQFLNDHRFVVNTMQELLLVDILEQEIDTLALNNEFPEMIENFHLLPGDGSRMLIATKHYPMDRDGMIQFANFNRKGEPSFDDSKDCRLYLFDFAQNSILSTAEIPHSLTAISDNGEDVFAGTFEGKVLKIGKDLRHTELFSAFKEPVFYLQTVGTKFVVIPHLEKEVLHDLGKGELLVFGADGSLSEKIELQPQEYPHEDQDSFFQVLPSSLIMKAFPDKDTSSLFINYGFNKLLRYDPATGEKEELAVDRKFADFHQLSPDGKQLLVAASDEKPTFSQPSDLEVYDLEQQKNVALFSEADPALSFIELKKIYSGGNYYYYGRPDAYSDHAVLYPSHQTRPLFLKNNGSTMDLDEDGNLLLVTGNRVTYGPLELSRIRKDSLNLDYGYSPEQDELPTELFQPYFDSREWETEFPFGIHKVQKAGEHFLALGYNDQQSHYYLLFDQEGNLLFERDGLEEAVWNQKSNSSGSGRFIALDYKKKNAAYLEVWDWTADKLVFKEKYDEELWWSYRFDVQEEVLLLRLTDEHGYTTIQEVDLRQAAPAPVTLIDRIATTDFAVDRKKGLLAIDNLTGYSILDLKTKKQLWALRTAADASIYQLEHGFGFGSQEDYYTVNTADFSSVYFTSFEGYQPIEISSSLYYSGEKNALKNIAIVAGNRGYLPSDYDLFLNRPDLVLETSGSTNTEYHQLIGEAVAKRTEELPTTDFTEFLKKRPLLQIADREQIPTYTSAKQETLKFQLRSDAPLSSYQVLVNGVPLYGKDGKQIPEGGNSFDAEVQLQLSRGANSIQFFGMDSEGFISNKEVVNIYSDYQETPRVHLVLISADSYNDSDYDLKYSVKDARDLAASLSRRYGSSLEVDSLFNEHITEANLNKLKEKLSKVSVNDRVILFLSGHGVLDSELEFRFATPDMDFSNIDAYGISNSRIESLLLNSPSREKLLLIDACHSGEFDREEYDTSLAEASGVRRYEGSKGAIATSVRSSSTTFELMNQLFTDVAVSTGIRVISAAAGDSYALESEKWNNGVFTYALLSTLEEHQQIPVSALKESTYRKVVSLTGGNQQPTSRGESIEFEFEL